MLENGLVRGLPTSEVLIRVHRSAFRQLLRCFPIFLYCNRNRVQGCVNVIYQIGGRRTISYRVLRLCAFPDVIIPRRRRVGTQGPFNCVRENVFRRLSRRITQLSNVGRSRGSVEVLFFLCGLRPFTYAKLRFLGVRAAPWFLQRP